MLKFFYMFTAALALFAAAMSAYGDTPKTGESPLTPKPPVSSPKKPDKKKVPVKKKPAAPTKPADAILEAICSVRTERCVSFAGNASSAGDVVPIGPPPRVVNALQPGKQCSYLQSMLSPASTGDAVAIQKSLGQAAPFTVQAAGDDLFIYSSASKLSAAQAKQLRQMEQQIGVLIAANAGAAVSFEIPIPHAGALGSSDAVVKMVRMIMPGFTVTAVGPARLRITAISAPDCASLRTMLEDVDRYARSHRVDTPVATALYMDLSTLAMALQATAIPFAAGGASTAAAAAATPAPAAANPPASPPAPPTVTITTASATTPTTAASGTGAGSTPASGGSTSATPGSGTTPSGDTTPTTGGTTTTVAVGSAAGATAAAAPTPPTPTAPPNFTVNGKELLFPEAIPPGDAGITERKRALALLDLPQPQVLINAWVVQNSTSSAKYAGELTNLVHDLVDEYNDVLQKTVDFGWRQVAFRTLEPNYFEPSFYNYVTERTVFEPRSYPDPRATAADKLLRETAGKASSVANIDPEHGICSQGQYCLGYQAFFRPVKPRLVDLLLTLIAANRPFIEAETAIDVAEGLKEPGGTLAAPPTGATMRSHPLRRRLFGSPEEPSGSCEDKDKEKLIRSVEMHSQDERMPLECFRQSMLFAESTTDGSPPPAAIGAIRAAVADFLFNYKVSQEYPHEFVPYDLTQSAQNLDSTLAPLIGAFNDDLRAFTTFLHARLETEVHDRGLDKDSKAFMNGGILTVRTTSGDASSVNTTTQSYINASKAPTPAQLIGNILAAQPGGAAGSVLNGVAANLSFNQAQVIMGALQSYQDTSINIGRQLNLLVKPRSLTGAQAVEMDVQLNADDTPNAPTYFTPGPGGGPGTAADLSRVAQHDIVTHVRVDSLRLFDISSLTAVLSKGRERFPLLPPFVELPYIGTLAGIPLRAAKEYHNSSAIMSAVIVPTASDIAFSLRFVSDRVVVGHPEDDGTCVWPPAPAQATPCTVRTATSFSDFAGQSIREFHRLKLYCLATLNQAPYPSPGQSPSKVDSNVCENLSFANTFHEEE